MRQLVGHLPLNFFVSNLRLLFYYRFLREFSLNTLFSRLNWRLILLNDFIAHPPIVVLRVFIFDINFNGISFLDNRWGYIDLFSASFGIICYLAILGSLFFWFVGLQSDEWVDRILVLRSGCYVLLLLRSVVWPWTQWLESLQIIDPHWFKLLHVQLL